MAQFTTKSILQHLINTSPQMQELSDFSNLKEYKQLLLNKLFELNKRDLINAHFLLSKQRGTYGEPLDVIGISISGKGFNFMENEEKNKSTITQNITIGATFSPLNIAGHNLKITNGADAEKFIERLLDNIEKSNLPPTKKKSVFKSIKDITVNISSTVFATLIANSIKGQ